MRSFTVKACGARAARYKSPQWFSLTDELVLCRDSWVDVEQCFGLCIGNIQPWCNFNFATGCWSLFSRTHWNWVESMQPSTFTGFPLAAQQKQKRPPLRHSLVQLSLLTSALYCWMNEAQWPPSIARWPWRSLEVVCGLSLTIHCVWRLACHVWPPGRFSTLPFSQSRNWWLKSLR